MTFNALILAGSRGGSDPLADYAGVADKAMIEIGGRTMLARVAAAGDDVGDPPRQGAPLPGGQAGREGVEDLEAFSAKEFASALLD